jgi:hypothetical protein
VVVWRENKVLGVYMQSVKNADATSVGRMLISEARENKHYSSLKTI